MNMVELKKFDELMMLYAQCDDPMIERYFDIDSNKMIDEKIAVLKALKDGKAPGEIPDFEKILELKPDNDSHWDI